MIQIVPAILATSEDQFQKDLAKLSAVEGLKEGWLHIDFADNEFVPNKTIGLDLVAKFSSDFKKEAHLMVSHPAQWIDGLDQAGFGRVFFHPEADDSIPEVIDLAKARGMEVGLAINPDTGMEKVEPFLDKIDTVLVMTVTPGFQGQPFIPEALDKIQEIKSKAAVKIGVDGHVDEKDVKQIVEKGADFIVVGSYLLKGDAEENLEKLWEALHN